MYEILLSILVSQREGLRNRSFHHSNFNRNLSQEDIDLLMNWTTNGTLLDQEPGAGHCQEIWDRLPDDPADTISVRLIFGFLYATIWLVSVCGNLSILYLSMVRRLKLTVKTTFIVILACSDLSITLTSLPVTAASIFTHVWLFGSFMCSSIGFFQGCSIFLSSFALTAIAIDRYHAVHYPHKRSRPRPVNLSSDASSSLRSLVPSAATFVGLLSCGALLSAPLLFISRLRPYPTICGQFCLEVWPQRLSWLRPTYGVAVPALQFGLPLLITCYCYSSIINYLNLRHKRRAAVEKMLPSSQRKSAGRRRRVARMMIAMVGFFIVCWFPMNFMNLARDYDFISSIIDTKNFNLYFAGSHLVAMTSVVWNPIIYGFFNRSFTQCLFNTCRPKKNRRFVTETRLSSS